MFGQDPCHCAQSGNGGSRQPRQWYHVNADAVFELPSLNLLPFRFQDGHNNIG